MIRNIQKYLTNYIVENIWPNLCLYLCMNFTKVYFNLYEGV